MWTALRFLRAFKQDPHIREEEVVLGEGDRRRDATLFAPIARPTPAPAWIVLHGITVSGRHHPSLTRFARAVAASGRIVLIPDVPSWRALDIDVEAAGAAMRIGSEWLGAHPEVDRSRGIGVVGFSFGATHALIAATDPALRDHLGGIVGFGGYADLRACFRFAFTGEHEWEGRRHRIAPDPYGRWIVAARYLPFLQGYGGLHRVADGARHLANASARSAAFAGDREFDAIKAEIANGLDAGERRVWEIVAPQSAAALPSGARRETALALADSLATQALREQPILDPAHRLDGLRARVVLAHGHGDRLIPYSETLRLREHLPSTVPAPTTITRLFAHSTGEGQLSRTDRIVETARFLRLIHRALNVV